ncbi:hypothetical protein BKA93DRAFT_379999 [Sparassis latifolia]
MVSTQSQASSDEEIGDKRPHKRRRTADQIEEWRFFSQVLQEELDVEIALRERLSDTIQSRITWALLLQESLGRDLRRHGPDESDFYEVALDTLDAMEAPCDIIIDREPRLPPKPMIVQPIEQAPLPPENSVTPQISFRAGSSRVRGMPRAPPPPARKLLFLHNFNTDPSEIAKLACPDCKRSDFSNLQGLLNHCRIRHHREYGSHDECIESCAAIVPEAERDWVVANGTELGGIGLPSLRRLFQIAVGEGEHVFTPKIESEAVRGADSHQTSDLAQDLTPTNTAITRTLGHHKDTPALAPFLGRAPKKRCINVYEGEDVDIIGGIICVDGRGRQAWHKPYTHRSIARPELDLIIPSVEESQRVDGDVRDDAQTEAGSLPRTEHAVTSSILGSRFHITARLVVVDQSLWLPSEHRVESRQNHTHRWRLSVTSPSYSLHITSFLAKLTVTCLTDPPPSTLMQPITITEPPFLVMGTTDKPFLARVMLTWVGHINPPMEIEHWVELDPLHLAHPVVGDEQVFDVELDRNTELRPVREDLGAIPWDDDHSAGKARSKSTDEKAESAGDPEYVVKLRSLLPQVPMTLRDVKGRLPAQLPYMLVSTPAQFRNLLAGRRKAIEMGRARALRDAYQRHCASHPEQDHLPLTGSDVYRWMEDENLFPRPVSRKRMVQEAKPQAIKRDVEPGSVAALSEIFCRNCGLHIIFHPTGVKREGLFPPDVTPRWTLNSMTTAPTACLTFSGARTRLPLFDVLSLTASRTGPRQYPLNAALFSERDACRSGDTPLSISALVASTDPNFITALRTLVSSWNLEQFNAGDQISADQNALLSTRTKLHQPREKMEEQLAPYAILALLTKSFAELLVHRGLDAFRYDEAAFRTLGREDRWRCRDNTQTNPIRLLTPSHVLRGLSMHVQGRLADGAALLSVARLGASLAPRAHITDAPTLHSEEIIGQATNSGNDHVQSSLEPRRVNG